MGRLSAMMKDLEGIKLGDGMGMTIPSGFSISTRAFGHNSS
jgi:hypothetical protein